MKIALTATEGRKVLDALVDVALSQGWDEDELEESGVIEEYALAVDAAMEAMGLAIEINPDEEDEDEDDFEEYDEDEFEEDDSSYHEELNDDDKELALIMYELVQEYMPELPAEVQVEIAANLCIKFKEENEGE